jgi:hypothetical protein
MIAYRVYQFTTQSNIQFIFSFPLITYKKQSDQTNNFIMISFFYNKFSRLVIFTT